MFSWYLIPLISTPQTFQVQLAGVNYQLTVKWNNAQDAGWQFDLANADTNTPLLAGQPFITGADCLAGLEYLGIGGEFWIATNGDDTAVPTFTNLGTESNLYFVVATTGTVN
jgi:hypothetical protein